LVILFLGAWSFGLRELLGLEQVRGWIEGRPHASRLRTGLLYRWLRHPMYVVLLGVWATPRMSFGHLLLALALTAYVLIAMRYEERELLHRFGGRYADWRGVPCPGLSASMRGAETKSFVPLQAPLSFTRCSRARLARHHPSCRPSSRNAESLRS
jgi:hypothetical protein